MTPDTELLVGRSLLSGAAWMTGLRWMVRGIDLISTLLLTRLLLPAGFGLVAMAATVVSLIEVLGYAEQMMTLIRHHNPAREHYDSVWTLSILLAAGLTAILWLAAEPAALYFHVPRMLWLVRFLALCALIGGFSNIGVVAFRRDLRFDREFCYQLVQRVLSATVTIEFALWLRDWRALAAGILVGRMLGMAASYVMHPYRPCLCFRRIPEILLFSGWMPTVNIAQFINDRADEFAGGLFVIMQNGIPVLTATGHGVWRHA